ncbi:Protein kinase-like domain [Pseudocohnilembus persalinus]|uniref:Protein kinase-like domain n=1 Tax=Pseudocohnilembus persalinus TaxID=266149 RepID=A0A0V0Q9Z7_PSEPJ|nr:Protein kinase-like domain [Pseudocohnilembus persalinus]|eukprot:KRW99049.1 Protein kinase-like domain [Pseudocohnilembus persalinus]
MNNLGTGSFGDVVKGMIYGPKNPEFPLYFAVKQVFVGAKGDRNVQRINQVKNEIRLLSTLKHQNIIRYLGFQQEDNNLNIFMELGTDTLKSKTQKYKQLPEQFVRRIMEEILLGLEYLHAHNIMHRDLKTANILFVNDKVKLADFGSAKQIQKANSSSYGEQFKSLIGTPQYMAPEVIRQEGRGRFSDIFSLGCIFYEMLTGKQLIPEKYKKMEEVINYIKKYDLKPDIQNKISDNANDFLLKCLKENPTERPNVYQLLRHPYITNSSMPDNNLSSNQKGIDYSIGSQNISKAFNSCIKYHESQNQNKKFDKNNDKDSQENDRLNQDSLNQNFIQGFLQSKKSSYFQKQSNEGNMFTQNMKMEKLQKEKNQNQNKKQMSREQIKQMMRAKQQQAKQQQKQQKEVNFNQKDNQFPATRQENGDFQKELAMNNFLGNIPKYSSENIPIFAFNKQKAMEDFNSGDLNLGLNQNSNESQKNKLNRQNDIQQFKELQQNQINQNLVQKNSGSSGEQIIQFDDDEDADENDLMDVNEVNENDNDKRKGLENHQYNQQYNKRGSIFSQNSSQNLQHNQNQIQKQNFIPDNRNINLLRGRQNNQNNQQKQQLFDDTDSLDANKHNVPPVFGLSRNQTEFLSVIDDENEENQVMKSKMKAIFELQEDINNKDDLDCKKRDKIQQMTYQIQNEFSDEEDDDIIDIDDENKSGKFKNRRHSQKVLRKTGDETQNDPNNVLYNPGPLRQQYSSDKNHPKYPKFMDKRMLTFKQQREKYLNLKNQHQNLKKQMNYQQENKENSLSIDEECDWEDGLQNKNINNNLSKQNSQSSQKNISSMRPIRKFGLKRQSQQQNQQNLDEFKTYNGGNKINKFEFNSVSGQNQESDDGGILNTQEDQNQFNSNYSQFNSNNLQKYYSYSSIHDNQFQLNLRQNTGNSQKNQQNNFTTNNTNHDNFKSFGTNSSGRNYFNANESFNQQNLNQYNNNINQNNFKSSNGSINHQFQSINSNQGQQNFYSFNNNNNLRGQHMLNDIQEQDELQGSVISNQQIQQNNQQQQFQQQRRKSHFQQFNTQQQQGEQKGIQRPNISRFQRSNMNDNQNTVNLI